MLVVTVTDTAAVHHTRGMTMKPTISAVFGAAVTVAVLVGCTTGTAEKVPTGADLKGTWDQTGFGYELGKAATWEDQTVVIEGAEGQGFGGFKEYLEGEGLKREIINGVVGVDGEILIVDEDGIFEGRLVDGKIVGRYAETGAEHGAINVELVRK